MVSRVVGSTHAKDIRWGGTHRVRGSTAVIGVPTNVPVSRRVRLHDQKTGVAVREAWSDAVTGEYQFKNIANRVYYVVAFDHTGTYSGVIETDITPEPMP